MADVNVSTIAVLGGTGKLGDEFVTKALQAGYRLRLLVRDPTKLALPPHSPVEMIVGDATSREDVAQVIKGADAVVSCLGNSTKGAPIMSTAIDNILSAAAEHTPSPHCVIVTSAGMGGTSKILYSMLRRVTGDPDGIDDLNATDERLQAEGTVPVTIVRPFGLTTNPGTGGYKTTTKSPVHVGKSIPRSDVATFLLEEVRNPSFIGPMGVQVAGL